MANLPAGRYELTTAFKGFATTVRKGIELSVGQSATIDVTAEGRDHRRGKLSSPPKPPSSSRRD